MNERTRIYLDNAAGTLLDPRVLDVMTSAYLNVPGNAGAVHVEGVTARATIESARATVARTLHAVSEEVLFTSGGTEANNLAIIGSVRALIGEGREPTDLHVVTTQVEHSSVMGSMRALASLGVRVTYLPVDEDGRVTLDSFKRALTPQTVLVSVIFAHNEIGTIQPIRELVRAVRGYAHEHNMPRIFFHTDASQAPAWFGCYVDACDVDLLTLDAQKVYGPKGVGCLYRRRGTPLTPILYAGVQQKEVRPGTAPTSLIVGCARALELVEAERSHYVDQVRALRDGMIWEVRARVPQAILNGATEAERLANSVNFSFPGLDGESIVVALDARGIAISARSACLHDDQPGSYTVRALGKGEEVATSAVRLSLSRYTTKDECVYATAELIDVIHWMYGLAERGEGK